MFVVSLLLYLISPVIRPVVLCIRVGTARMTVVGFPWAIRLRLAPFIIAAGLIVMILEIRVSGTRIAELFVFSVGLIAVKIVSGAWSYIRVVPRVA